MINFEKNWFVYVFVIGIFFILLSGFIIYIEFQKQTNQCLSNPLTYSAKWMEEKYNTEFQGYGYLKTPKGALIPIVFNKTSYTIKNS